MTTPPGTLYTPLVGAPVMDWYSKPDVPTSLLNGLTQLERYAVIPVTDAPTRETKIPTGNRWIGMVTYNANTDAFEYWNGTSWLTVNRALNMAAHLAGLGNLGSVLSAGQYVDYKVTITVTKACFVLLFGSTTASVTTTPTTWQGLNCQVFCDNTITAAPNTVNSFYPAQSGTANLATTAMGRFQLAVGTHTLGVRSSAAAGSGTLHIGYVTLLGIRGSVVANSAAGSGAYGDW